MNLRDATTGASLRELGAAYLLGVADAGAVIASATDAVAVGDSGDAVLALASLYRDADRWEVVRAVDAALVERNGAPLQPESEELAVLALRVVCRRFLAGGIGLRELSSWAHRVIGHGGDPSTWELVELDDDLDLAEYGLPPLTAGSALHVEAERRIHRFLAATA